MAIATLKSKHYELARMLMSGMRQCDIAEELCMSDTQVSIVVHSPLFKQYMSKLQDRANDQCFSVRAYMQEHVKLAAKKVVALVDNSMVNPATQLSASMKVLRLAGEDIEDDSKGVGKTVININAMTFEQKLQASGEIQEAEYEEDLQNKDQLGIGTNA